MRIETARCVKSMQWECRIVANTSAFQAEDAGSIPVIPSTIDLKPGLIESRAFSMSLVPVELVNW